MSMVRGGVVVAVSRRLSVVVFAALAAQGLGAAPDRFEALEHGYRERIRPLLARFCLECHSSKKREGELDLERFSRFADVRRDPAVWQKVVQMLDDGEMPPRDSPQLTAAQHRALRSWAQSYLDAEARAQAGDPGPVVLRRLNNAEYTHTVRDLTGLRRLAPTREFPVDGAAGEGFTNTGQALAMSPALVTKYVDAAKRIADHVVLLPEGFRFSPGTSRRDFTDEILGQIRALYLRHAGRQGDVNSLNRWNVPRPKELTDRDGRVELGRYFEALIGHRDELLDDVDTVEAIARQQGLNARYLRHLAEMLVSAQPESALLDHLRRRWRRATLSDTAAIVAEIRVWQDQLWKFNVIGHFGSIRPWQEPVSPPIVAGEFRVPLAPRADRDEVTLFLSAQTAGDGNAGDVVRWRAARIERAGRPPLLLRDARAVAVGFRALRKKILAATAKYLAVVYEARGSEKQPDAMQLAAAHGVDAKILQAWLSYLGVGGVEPVVIAEYLNERRQQKDHAFVKGWRFQGLNDLVLYANTSDQPVKIPGDMNPHQIAVHPRPERWVAIGWKSPITGQVRVAPRVKDAHASCGNGVSWSLELRRSSGRRVLRSGVLEQGGKTDRQSLDGLSIAKGDLISLVIGPRDGQHACDLTEIDLAVSQQDGGQQSWSLSGDCADDIDAGNPHADRFGNQGVWHFYTGRVRAEPPRSDLPEGSLLARWADTSDAIACGKLATQLQALVSGPLPTDVAPADRALYGRLRSWDGPLFAGIDAGELIESVTSEQLQASQVGVDPRRFGRHPNGSSAPPEDLVVQAPSVIQVRLPAELVAGSDLVVTADLVDADGPHDSEGSVQLQIADARPPVADTLVPGLPIIVAAESEAAKRLQRSMDRFRSLFPIAMCYPQIVPVDEVVTLVLFHREDAHLSRLMLDPAEVVRLDRLWEELHYVSRDALMIVDALEQIREFATQLSATNALKYNPLREPIRRRAESFRRRLVETEPAHLDALVDFAARCFRRPLRPSESQAIRGLYHQLRNQELPHEQAFRLSFTRILSTPAFLYRLEKPAAGEQPKRVSDWELASRLSYFLWSSMPDQELRRDAAARRLQDPETLLRQTRRMLRHDYTRRLAIEFTCQWLGIRNFDRLDDKSERHFPQFRQLRGAMYEESVLFLTDLFQSDRSLLSLFAADHTFLNEALAGHYRIPWKPSTNRSLRWRPVDGVRRFGRGGILAQAAVLSKYAGASRTSAILRGDWVSETLLGERLPRPPQNVPQLPEVAPAGLTERQLVEKHSSDPACAKCHERIDPYGFALEGFDAIGRARQKNRAGQPIDTRTTLVDGTQIQGLEGLRQYLLSQRRESWVRQFCRKLLGYALGRGVQLSDELLLDRMMEHLAENDYRVSAAIEAVVLSEQFRKIRGVVD